MYILFNIIVILKGIQAETKQWLCVEQLPCLLPSAQFLIQCSVITSRAHPKPMKALYSSHLCNTDRELECYSVMMFGLWCACLGLFVPSRPSHLHIWKDNF